MVAGAALLLVGCRGHPATAATVDGSPVAATTLARELAELRANPAALGQIEQQGPIAGSGLDGFSAPFVAQVLDSEVQRVVLSVRSPSRS